MAHILPPVNARSTSQLTRPMEATADMLYKANYWLICGKLGNSWQKLSFRFKQVIDDSNVSKEMECLNGVK